MATAKLCDIVYECLQEARLQSNDSKKSALQMLVSITKVSPRNRNLVAQTDGAILTILSLLNSSYPAVHALSLCVLFNLSLNPIIKRSLISEKTIHLLNSVIRSPPYPESRKLAASLICSLAMLDKNKAIFGVFGTVPTLVTAISGPRGPEAHHLLSSLAELVQFHGNCTLAIRSGAVGALLKIVRSTGGDDLTGTSLAILGLLARLDEGLQVLRRRKGIVSDLVEALQRRCMSTKEGAAELLVRLFNDSEECIDDALSLPEFLSVLADLSVIGSGRAREKASLLMEKISKTDEDIPMLSGWQ